MLSTPRTRTKPAKRPRKVVENDAYVEMLGRCIRVLARRIVDGNLEDIGKALALRAQLDDAIGDAVRELNAAGESWARIGAAAGISMQGAQQRWGRKVVVSGE